MARKFFYNSDEERKDALREQKRQWAIKNKERMKAYAKEYYEKNKDIVNEKNKIRNKKYKYIRVKVEN